MFYTVREMNYQFDWDPNKARRNTTKHLITFQQATTIFRDPNQLSLYDAKHSDMEDRWITIGLDSQRNLLVVVHTYLQELNSARIRIISARKAEREEAADYYSQYN